MIGFRRRPRLTATQRIILDKAEEIEALLDRIDHAQPCPEPECMEFRAEMRDIIKDVREGKHHARDA